MEFEYELQRASIELQRASIDLRTRSGVSSSFRSNAGDANTTSTRRPGRRNMTALCPGQILETSSARDSISCSHYVILKNADTSVLQLYLQEPKQLVESSIDFENKISSFQAFICFLCLGQTRSSPQAAETPTSVVRCELLLLNMSVSRGVSSSIFRPSSQSQFTAVALYLLALSANLVLKPIVRKSGR